jgi:hypothetical protein
VFLTLYNNYIEGYRPVKLETRKRVDCKPVDISSGELNRMLRLLSLLLDLDKSTTQKLNKLISKFKGLGVKSGLKFLTQYWSESFRLVGSYISGVRIKQNKIWVKTYKNGLPRILGNRFKQYVERNVLLLKNNKLPEPLFRAIITIFSWNRVLGPKHEIKFNSVTTPHSGEIESLPLDLIKNSLKKLSLDNTSLFSRLRKPKFFLSTKAGANSMFAFLSVGLDMIAFVRNFPIALVYVRLCLHCGFYGLALVFILSFIICLPLSLLIYTYPVYLGRLNIVLELKGKARVIGITDQWSQWLLKPLHDALSDILKEIPEDGTFNQLKPVKVLMECNKGSKTFNSLDLSNATDRLPVKLQSDILNCLGFPGDLWMQLLQRPYHYGGIDFRYAVGQPMGAYSSFAMLALSNHILVLSSLEHYNKGTGQYAVLGDDVAIHGNIVAEKYTKFLIALGVEVNPIKGFYGELVGFAKNWFHTSGVNLTPIGGKVLMRTSRKPVYFVSLIMDFFNKEYHTILKTVLQQYNQIFHFLLNKDLDTFVPGTYHKKVIKWLFSSLGPQSGLHSIYNDNVDLESIKVCYQSLLTDLGLTVTAVSNFYVNKISRSSWVRPRNIYNILIDYFNDIKFIFKPQVWSSKKFNYLNIQHGSLALVVSAAAGPLLLILVTRKLLFAILSLLLPLLYSLFLLLIGGSHLSRRSLDLIYNYKNTFKRWYHNYKLTRPR